ncbi:hypothetical protein CYLTODRAFT_294764 [Cylindrobasidium torrendii FP15055 ss-10]|uniref:Enhancer of polycomb-like protein n=1 Tax=Cylindrobasidium torrendii FP15055 ss-10 TaxID=1314674 RepID=A0A0D7BAY4_9AGAR|nr:hypothetical protein CYLTODRAFT_294764 [Cylindrobasidium torrendii FP15055 ss-10]
MVRHPQPHSLPQTKRRITHKTRLRVTVGEVAEHHVADEEDEQYRFHQRSFGVDREDVNEKHLQDVLSEAERSHGGGSDKPKAFIPTPGSTGIVPDEAHYAHYPRHKWRDPHGYVCSSTTVEESATGALAHGLTYYLDERDKEWLDCNNEEARGESTSTNARAASVCLTARSKGKEPETASHPVAMTEDEFELVMGLFELITQEETALLHHSLELGMEFPSFTKYQEILSRPLPTRVFATFAVPRWVPKPPQLVAMAAAVYPHWKARRIDRRGHPIIPSLNLDETDTLNEGYVCFRHREAKAVRKTRASQANPIEKLQSLQRQLQQPLEIIQTLLRREFCKQGSGIQACNIWKARLEMVELRRRTPGLASKADDEILVDKDQNVRLTKSRVRVPPPHKRDSHSTSVPPTARPEPSIRPSDRSKMVLTEVETAVSRREDHDMDWENVVDSPYVSPYHPPSSRLFKFVTPTEVTSDASAAVRAIRQRRTMGQNVRLRAGRNGRTFMDRRPGGMVEPPLKRVRTEEPEDACRLAEQWRFDADDAPARPFEGFDEQDRMLVDDRDDRFLRHRINIVAENELVTDYSLVRVNAEGKRELVAPFRSGLQGMNGLAQRVSQVGNVRRVSQPLVRPVGTAQPSPTNVPSAVSTPAARTPVPTPTTTNGAMVMPYTSAPKSLEAQAAAIKSAFASAGHAAFSSPSDIAKQLGQLGPDGRLNIYNTIRKANVLREGAPPASSA